MKAILMKPKRGYAKPTNYAAFYALLKQLPGANKEDLVLQFTNGRTDSLREISLPEYNEALRVMNELVTSGKETEYDRLLRRGRSNVLRQMHLLGVNTADWKAVDTYCLDKRIAGKRFYYLCPEELDKLLRKLYSIQEKKKKKEE